MTDFFDYSLDLETLSVHPGAAILSIGCVQFDRHTGKIGASHYVEIDHVSALKNGEVLASTLEWWTKNHPALLAQLLAPKPQKRTLATALDEFSRWMRNISAGSRTVVGALKYDRPHRAVVWGNGATMDISLLEHAFRHGGYGLSVPWDFRDIRDMRTIVDAARHVAGDPEWWPDVPAIGTAHNALDDAVYQAHAIAACFNRIAGKPATKVATKPVTVTEDEDDL